MRLIRILIVLLSLAVGLAIGALNAQPVSLDPGVTTLHATLGVCVLLTLLLGVLIGLVLPASVVLPLRRRRRLRRSPPETPVACLRAQR